MFATPAMQDQVVLKKKLLFSVNAKSPQSSNHEMAKEIQREVANMEFASPPVKVPIAWFLFERDIWGLAVQGIISLDKCRECASQLSMDESSLQAAVIYLDDLNILFYTPSLLPNAVFSDPHILFDMVSELAIRCKVNEQDCVQTGKWLQSAKQGIVTMEMLDIKELSHRYTD